jgi:type III restriction enzyme
MRRFEVGDEDGGDDGEEPIVRVQVDIADKNVDDLYAAAGRLLGEGLHREYLRECWDPNEEASARNVKIELSALVATPGVLDEVNASADALRKHWTNAHKAAVPSMDEKDAQTWRDIEGAGSEPEELKMKMPGTIEGTKNGQPWDRHIYSDGAGKFHQTFTSSWERKVVERELARDDVVGWLRNQDRKQWALCVPRKQAGKWAGIYPDFIFFRDTQSGLLADVIDPHLLSDQDAPARAKALAEFAQKHAAHFGRFEMVIFDGPNDEVGKRLDLMDEPTRNKVTEVSTHNHLRQLFEAAPTP